MGKTVYEQTGFYLVFMLLFSSYHQILLRSGCLEDTNFQLPVWSSPLMTSASSLLPKTAQSLSVSILWNPIKPLYEISLKSNSLIWQPQLSSVFFVYLQGMLRVARNCTWYPVVEKVQRIGMLDIQLMSCVWLYHQMENTWWVDMTVSRSVLSSSALSYCNSINVLLTITLHPFRPLETWINWSWFGRQRRVNICISLQDTKAQCRYALLLSLCCTEFYMLF